MESSPSLFADATIRLPERVVASVGGLLSAAAFLALDRPSRGYQDRVGGGVAPPVSAEYCVTSCDLGVFVDEAADPVSPQNPDICACGGRTLASGGICSNMAT